MDMIMAISSARFGVTLEPLSPADRKCRMVDYTHYLIGEVAKEDYFIGNCLKHSSTEPIIIRVYQKKENPNTSWVQGNRMKIHAGSRTWSKV